MKCPYCESGRPRGYNEALYPDVFRCGTQKILFEYVRDSECYEREIEKLKALIGSKKDIVKEAYQVLEADVLKEFGTPIGDNEIILSPIDAERLFEIIDAILEELQ